MAGTRGGSAASRDDKDWRGHCLGHVVEVHSIHARSLVLELDHRRLGCRFQAGRRQAIACGGQEHRNPLTIHAPIRFWRNPASRPFARPQLLRLLVLAGFSVALSCRVPSRSIGCSVIGAERPGARLWTKPAAAHDAAAARRWLRAPTSAVDLKFL